MIRAIGNSLTDIQRAQFIAAARSLMHVRWRHQGRNKRGVDCAGLIVYSLRAVGCRPLDAIGYGRIPYRGMLEKLMEDNLGKILPRAFMQEGDVCLMRFAGAPSHCGIITAYPYGEFSLLHAFAQNREVVEHRIDANWFNYIVGVYRP